MNHDTLKQLVQLLFELLADHFKDKPVIRAVIEALEAFALANLDRLLDKIRIHGLVPAVTLLAVLAGPAAAGEADVRAKAALAAAVAELSRPANPCDCGCAGGGACDCPSCPARRAAGPSEAELYGRAVREGVPLLYFVGQPARPVAGCLSYPCSDFPGVAGPAVVVATPRGEMLWRSAALPGAPTDAAIFAALRPAAPPACAGGCCGCCR
jgi:hypothetical protein